MAAVSGTEGTAGGGRRRRRRRRWLPTWREVLVVLAAMVVGALIGWFTRPGHSILGLSAATDGPVSTAEGSH